MSLLNFYLNFPGTAEKAFKFYQSVFGGEFAALQRFKEMSDSNLPESDQEKIMHIALPLGHNNVLMGSDALGHMGHSLSEGNNFSLALSAGSEDEAHHLFNALSAEGEVRMPMQRMFWGALFGMLTDRFGIQWMISFDEKYPQ